MCTEDKTTYARSSQQARDNCINAFFGALHAWEYQTGAQLSMVFFLDPSRHNCWRLQPTDLVWLFIYYTP